MCNINDDCISDKGFVHNSYYDKMSSVKRNKADSCRDWMRQNVIWYAGCNRWADTQSNAKC